MTRVFHVLSTFMWKTWWGLVLVVAGSFALLAQQAAWREGFGMGDPVEYANEAYRLAHGVPEETWSVRGKRTGFVALLYAAPLRAAFAADLAPEKRLLAIKLAAALFGAATVLLTCLIASSLAGRGAGVAAGALLATNALFIEVGCATYAEIPCAFFFALALWLVLCRDAPAAAGLALGTTVLCRYQALMFVPFVMLWVLVYRPRAAAAAFAGGVIAALLALGAVDQVRHGRAFASFATFLSFESRVMIREAAAYTSDSPWYTYLRFAQEWLERTGPVVLAIALVRAPAAIGRERFLALALPSVGMVAALSFIPHKELRFLVPLLPALYALCALAPGRRGLALVASVALALAPAFGMKRVLAQEKRAFYTGQRDAVRAVAARDARAVVLTATWSLCLAEHAEDSRIVNFRPSDAAPLTAVAPRVTHLVASRQELSAPGLEAAVTAAGFRLVGWFPDAGAPYALYER
jgi:phosphatidylinositol glycan class B